MDRPPKVGSVVLLQVPTLQEDHGIQRRLPMDLMDFLGSRKISLVVLIIMLLLLGVVLLVHVWGGP